MLPLFHALTGCDTVSGFAGHGKKSAWTTWNALPALTGALLELHNHPNKLCEDAISTVVRFVIVMYDQTSTAIALEIARKKLYLKKHDPEKIPPSKGALLQHLNRALLQGSCIWGQILSPRLTLHSPTDWGWKFCNEQYEPL